ncbi:MAG: GumC family protein [Planctomycetaceae bacterium]|nr:GumC family protein [Planctomycetaceae bacterium]
MIEPQLAGWLTDRARTVVTRRWLVVRFFLVTMTLVTSALLLWPRTYHSQAKLFVRLGRESVALDPTVTTGATIAVSDTREHEINSVMEMLGNRSVLEDVVRVLGADAVLGDAPLPEASIIERRIVATLSGPLTTTLAVARPTPEAEKAIKVLESIVTSGLAKRSSVIHVTCEARSPELAQTILKVFLAAFQSQHAQALRMDRSLPFFEEQSNLLRGELETATAELVAAKNDAGVVSLEDRRQAMEEDLTQLRHQVQESSAALTSFQATLSDLRQKSRDLPHWQITEEINGQPDDAIGTTRRALHDLQIRERDLMTRYTARHPLVVATRQQISQAEQLLSGAGSMLPAETKRTPDPGWQQVHLQQLATEAEAEAVRGKAAKLEQQLVALEAERQQLNRQDGRIRRLQQEVEVLQASYGTYLERREQARIAQALERERISNVNVIQPASYVSQPVSPKRGLIFAVALFVAATGGIGTTLLAEAFARDGFRGQDGAPEWPCEEAGVQENNQGCDDAIEHASELVAASRY